jgi:hypothetical protein
MTHFSRFVMKIFIFNIQNIQLECSTITSGESISNADTVQKLKNAYETEKLFYQGMPLRFRPRIPK